MIEYDRTIWWRAVFAWRGTVLPYILGRVGLLTLISVFVYFSEVIVQEAFCPVILLIHEPNPGFVREAARRGIFAYITDGESDDDSHEWQSSIDIVLRRFTEYHDLQGAFGRRAVIERAKGILMERHSVDEDDSFELLRSHARTSNRKLVDVATAVVDGHALLPKAVG